MWSLCRCTASTAKAQGYENPHTNADPASDFDRDLEADSSGSGICIHQGLIYKKISTPITFDFHHHRFNTSGLTEEEALILASTTWGNATQLTHYSSCKKTYEDASVIARSHADYIYEQINTYNRTFDIELECKMKDLALIKYRTYYTNLRETYLPFDDKSILEKNQS